MNEHLTDIVTGLASQITEQEGRDRKRNGEAQAHFLHGIENLIIQLWKGTQIHEGFEDGINKRAGWYSENSRYRDPNFTYKQTVAAYGGLIKLGLVQTLVTTISCRLVQSNGALTCPFAGGVTAGVHNEGVDISISLR